MVIPLNMMPLSVTGKIAEVLSSRPELKLWAKRAKPYGLDPAPKHVLSLVLSLVEGLPKGGFALSARGLQRSLGLTAQVETITDHPTGVCRHAVRGAKGAHDNAPYWTSDDNRRYEC